MTETPSAKPDEKPFKPEARWALFAGFGSFLLYLFGYLTLRFHLGVLGVDTGLSVLDERYLFAGAQFLVYLLTSVPIALVFVFFARQVLRKTRPRFLIEPHKMVLFGIAVSIVLIQFVMRQCLPLMNLLLLRDPLPGRSWVQAILLDGNGGLQSLYFSALLAVVMCLAWLLLAANRGPVKPPFLFSATLAGLVLIQFLLLPVNFGILIVDQNVPRVATINGKDPLQSNTQAWRIWEAADSVTFLVRRWNKHCETRTLLTLDKQSVKQSEIQMYDPLIKRLHRWPSDAHPASVDDNGCGPSQGAN
jgi:hypothetical protein